MQQLLRIAFAILLAVHTKAVAQLGPVPLLGPDGSISGQKTLSTGGYNPTLQSLANRFAELPSLKTDQAADMSGSTAASASNKAALLRAIALGGIFRVPPGGLVFDPGITIDKPIVFLCASPTLTGLTATGTTGDVFTITAPGVRFEGCGAGSGSKRTAGSFFNIQANAFRFVGSDLINAFNGFNVNAPAGSVRVGTRIEGGAIRGTAPGGTSIILDGASNTFLSRLAISDDGSTAPPTPGSLENQPLFGVKVLRSVDLFWDHSNCTRQGGCLAIVPTSAQVIGVYLTAVNLDLAAGNNGGSSYNGVPNLLIAPTGTGSATQVVCAGCELGNSAGDAAVINPTSGGTVDSVSFNNSQGFNNKGFAIRAYGGNDIQVNGGTYMGGNAGLGSSFSYGGIYLGASTVNAKVAGSRVGPSPTYAGFSNFGVQVDAGADGACVMGVNARGATASSTTNINISASATNACTGAANQQ